MMKNILLYILILLANILLTSDVYYAVSYSIACVLVIKIFFESNNKFVFREWALFLYALNYLLAPAITYQLPEDLIFISYRMQLSSDAYFNLALPGFLLFALGMYALPTSIFKVNFSLVNQSAIVNKDFLIKTTIFGLFLSLTSSLFPGELVFLAYLLSMVRFVGAFALIAISRKYWYYPVMVLLLELGTSFLAGMFHDVLMWIIFFGLFYIYAVKPSIRVKAVAAVAAVSLILFVQLIKGAYRTEVWGGSKEASFETVAEVGSTQASSEGLTGENNLLGTLNRGNQAWIFASTVANMDRQKNFQGLTNVNKYLEAALLPRFLAPNKISSGDRHVFNSFSGHSISEGTAMGLGIFADGYIAYGAWGVYIFTFTLGLIFALTFKLVERWAKISPFYVLLLLPLLNYAVRPDCELQTTINHLAKGILLFGFLVYLTKKRFTLDSTENKRKLLHLNLMTKNN